jgi:aconitase A
MIPTERQSPFTRPVVPARLHRRACDRGLAAMRSAVARLGGDPGRINPVIPVDLVIDHSLQVDAAGVPDALQLNVKREYRTQPRTL